MAPPDRFKAHYEGGGLGRVDWPATRGFAITPANGADLASQPRAVWVGGAGDLTWVGDDGVSVTLKAVPVGTLLPIRPWQVSATGTTATFIVGLA